MLGMKVEFYRHNLEKEDIEKACEVLRSVFLTTGEVTRSFEDTFARHVGLDHAVGVTSCTAALHLSLLALGIGPGDEVITSPMTFLATATSILHAGATPVFVDVEPDTGLIDPNRIERAITPRTKAILPVHLYGVMADMRAIAEIAEKRGLAIVEDCAHCIEGERQGIRPGQLSDAACYSFYATKNLTSGEGGAIATGNAKLAEKVRMLRLHGMSKDAISRYQSKFRHWDMEMLGWKYNMDNIHAALLVHQLDRLESYWQRRRDIAQMYRKNLEGVAGVVFPKIHGKSAYHLQTIWLDALIRDRAIDKLQEEGIGVAVNYRALPVLRYFRETFGFRPEDFPHAFAIGERTITLPLYPKLKDEEVYYVIERLEDALASFS